MHLARMFRLPGPFACERAQEVTNRSLSNAPLHPRQFHVRMERKSMSRRLRHLITAMVPAVTLLLSTTSASATTLVVFDAPWCVVCKKFEAEVLPTYGKSDFAMRLSFYAFDYDRQNKVPFKLTAPIRSTPTFVLVERGQEVARFSGYTDPRNFYETLAHYLGPHL